MPRISEFYGILIYMYFKDHAPPLFHAIYAEYEAEVAIATGDIIRGSLPRRARRLVEEWAEAHRVELEDDWARAQSGESLIPIEPLE